MPVEAEQPEYFQTVSTYIHLNPARAKLIGIGEQKLWEYPWSSYPQYVRGEAPEWLARERVLGSLGLGPEERQGYESYMEARALEVAMKAGRQELDQAWKVLRRGWYVGGEGFGETLLARAKNALLGKKRESHTGRMAHDRRQAEGMLKRGLRVLGLPEKELAVTPKGKLEKQILAWWIYGRTTVSRRWIAENLMMGYETAVSRAVSFVESSADDFVIKMKEVLASIHER